MEPVFIPPPALQRVRNENEQLRQQLRDLSQRLDDLLSSYPKKTADAASLRSKEISIARTHLEHHEKQLRDLLRAQALLSPSRVAELQAEAETLQNTIRGKEAGNKGLKRLEKERGWELSSLTEDTGALAAAKSASDTTRRLHKAVSDVEKELLRGEEAHKSVTAHVVELEAKYKQELGKSQAAGADEEPKPLPVAEQDLEIIKRKFEALEKKRNADVAGYRHSLQSAEAQLALIQKQLLEVQNSCKDKDRQARIACLAVKETSHTLKMLQKKNETMSATLKSTPKNSEEGSTSFVTAPIEEQPAA